MDILTVTVTDEFSVKDNTGMRISGTVRLSAFTIDQAPTLKKLQKAIRKAVSRVEDELVERS